VAERKEEEDEGRGPCVSEGEGGREAGWAEPAGKPRPKRSGEGGGLLGWWRGKWAGERRVKRAGERRGKRADRKPRPRRLGRNKTFSNFI
jgi:hypothetical protein